MEGKQVDQATRRFVWFRFNAGSRDGRPHSFRAQKSGRAARAHSSGGTYQCTCSFRLGRTIHEVNEPTTKAFRFVS